MKRQRKTNPTSAASRRGRATFLCCLVTCSALGVACTTPTSAAREPASRPVVASTPPPATSKPQGMQPDAVAPDAGSLAAKAPVICPELPSVAESGTPCGDLHCLAFDSVPAAFAHVLAGRPRVLGIGETHAQRGAEKVASATRRFAEWMLPSLCGRTKAMIMELWLPRKDCGDKRVEQVEKAQKPATETQAKSNQNEYVTLGYVAKRFGIEPSALIPTCEEYQSILDAGPDSIERMLALVGSKTGDRLVEELRRNPNSESDPVVIAYGGALHNDADPTPEHQNFSYGPRLLAETQGHYVELDLIVREFVKDTEIWQKMPYYKALKKDPLPHKTLVYNWGKHSFGLVFPSIAAVQATTQAKQRTLQSP